VDITVRKENCWNVRRQEYMLHDKTEASNRRSKIPLDLLKEIETNKKTEFGVLDFLNTEIF
jgi:hypothetical protein